MNTFEAAKKIAAELFENAGEFYGAPIVREEDGEVRIYWDGPTNWAMNDNYYEFEDAAAEARSMGVELKYEYRPYWTDPKGFYTEPYNYYTLAVYRD